MTSEPKAPEPARMVPVEHDAVAQANRMSDYWVLMAGVVASLGLMAAVFLTGLGAVLYGEEIVENSEVATTTVIDAAINLLAYALIVAIALGLILTLVRMMRQQYLGNALQVEYSDYAWLREWSNKVAADLKMPRVEIMVAQDPVMNAFAFGFASPYTIVLHSGSIRWLSAEQLKAVVVHEMAHVKYHHTKISTYLMLLRMVPGIGVINGWFLDFWGRRAEYTADRLAVQYLQDPTLVKEALIGISVGPDVASSFNEVARQWQVYMTDNYFNRFTQTFSSHPFLVRRLQRVDATLAAQVKTVSPSDSTPGEPRA